MNKLVSPKGYTLLRRLGIGGFGEVWEAETIGQPPIAVKFPTTTEPRALERFHREVRLQSALDHPNIVEVLDFDLEQEPPWVAMPLAQHNLQDQIENSTDSTEQLLQWFKESLAGIEYAHANHVIHRDLKPTNILLFAGRTADSPLVARVADFGLSRRFTRHPETFQTLTGEAYGTRWFTAPEQWSGFREAQSTADIYSLGRILQYFVEFRPSIKAEVPAISHCITVATRDDPDARYQSVTEFQSEIDLLTRPSAILMQGPVAQAKSAMREILASPEESTPLANLLHIFVRNTDDFRLLQSIFSRTPYEVIDRLLADHSGPFRLVISAYVDSLEQPLPVDAVVRGSNLLDHCLDVSRDQATRARCLIGLIRIAAIYELQELTDAALHRLYFETDAATLIELAVLLKSDVKLREWISRVPDRRLLPDLMLGEGRS